MAYNCYLDGVLMPQTPAALSLKIKGKNTTLTLLNEGEINILKSPGLTEIELTLVFPMLEGKLPPTHYLALLEKLKTEKKTTQFILTRSTPDGKLLFDTNIKVSLEDYEQQENAADPRKMWAHRRRPPVLLVAMMRRPTLNPAKISGSRQRC